MEYCPILSPRNTSSLLLGKACSVSNEGAAFKIARRRSACASNPEKVAVLDPMGIVKGAAKTYRVNYDPLSDIAIGTDDEISQIQSIGEAIVMNEEGGESHWTDSARIILNGIIEAVLHIEKDTRKHTLGFVREVYQRGLGEYEPNKDGYTPETAKDYLR